jgi:phage FluMu protein gp41
MTAATVIKQLPFPWKVAGKEVNEVELRAPLLEDLIEAEKEAHPGANPTAFNVALACRQMVRAGTYTGPFTIGQFKAMKPASWYVIRDALSEADALGEAVQPSQAQPS